MCLHGVEHPKWKRLIIVILPYYSSRVGLWTLLGPSDAFGPRGAGGEEGHGQEKRNLTEWGCFPGVSCSSAPCQPRVQASGWRGGSGGDAPGVGSDCTEREQNSSSVGSLPALTVQLLFDREEKLVLESWRLFLFPLVSARSCITGPNLHLKSGCRNFPWMTTSKGFYQISKVCGLWYWITLLLHAHKTKCGVAARGCSAEWSLPFSKVLLEKILGLFADRCAKTHQHVAEF